MLKAKNIMIILILNYLLIVVFCSFSELLFIGNKATQVQLMIRTAADMALEQVQATDDFFLPGDGYMLDSNTSAYTIQVPYKTGDGYIKVPAYQAITDKMNKLEIYEAMYGNGKMSSFIANTQGNVLDITVTAGYWRYNPSNPLASGLTWYKIPKIAQMGINISGDSAKRVYNTNGQRISLLNEIVDDLWKTYELDKHEKTAYHSNGTIESYFMTPLSLGITYINEDALQYFFMNNMELLMRSKYVDSNKSLNTAEGGKGLLEGSTYTNYIDKSRIDTSNPINNGEFTLLRGNEYYSANTGALLYEGVKPTIRYKVIDLYDSSPENDKLLKLLFGANTGEYRTKAEYFRSLDANVYDPATNLPYEHKPIVVAEVTFYADVIIPYSTLPLREMRAKEDESNQLGTLYFGNNGGPVVRNNNYLDIVRTGSLSTGKKSMLYNSSDVMQYTRLFAVAP